MTNKEAIWIINNRLNTYYCTDNDLKALDKAIEALEEQTLNIAALKRDLPELFKPEYDGGYLLEKES